MSLYAVLQAKGLLGIGVAEEAESIFDEIAETLLNETILRVGGRPYRLVEIEFYANGSTHPDPFAHCDEMQLRTAHWYFHRTGEEYRGGSFKGLDITFAPEGYYGGILIRTIEGLVGEGEEEVFISGPSLSVDHILAGCGAGSVVELVERMGDRSVVREDAERLLWLEHDPSISKREVVKTPRFGLFLKRGDGKNTPAESLPSRYVMREYRYISDARRVKKGRHFTSLSLALQGADLETIHQRVGTPRKSIASYIEAFEAGKQKALRSFFYKDVSTTEQCELYGACAAAGYTRYGKA
ncbi:DNA-3-methyladenine glycosylase [Myxococcota bacterium]|nr:DNA-3-methyladenine glycosylase [Myxococcota bacterium]